MNQRVKEDDEKREEASTKLRRRLRSYREPAFTAVLSA